MRCASLLSLACICLAAASLAQADAARLAQLVDYVGVDYNVAVRGGEVINKLEYGEMQEFASLISSQVAQLKAEGARAELAALARELEQAVDAKAAPSEIARITDQMTARLLELPALAVVPADLPDLEAAAATYKERCASCHGAHGEGDGPAAAALTPAPTDFTDSGRAEARSLYGLYNTITLGVEGTAMTAFDDLPRDMRWALAFYVGGLHAEAQTLREGEEQFAATPVFERPTLRELTTGTFDDVAASQGEAAAALHAWLRLHPAALANGRDGPLVAAMSGIRRSLDLYADGDAEAALDAAIDAYLEGFELAEAALSTTHPELVLETEVAMISLRQAIRGGRSTAAVRAAGQDALTLLREARDSRTGESLSPGVSFVSALIILLREGLEAILVLGAIAAFLRQTGRRDAMPWLHGGWISALAVGVLTWVVSTYLIAISGATREMTEGITALIAAGMLFYVGFWMHSKLNAARWQHFLESNVERALNRRGLWAITGIAFIAVYREVFEVVLFFQALWAQATAPAAESSLLAGAVLGGVLIVATAWAIFRFGVRLPLRQFFAVTAAVMIALAVVFTGKGVAALQEAGKLPIDTIAMPRIEFLGIYPTIQSVAAQLTVLLAAAALVVYLRRTPPPINA